MFEFFLSLIFGYEIAKNNSKPGSKLHQKLPFIKIKFIQISPNLKIDFREKIIHIHHWLYMSLLLIISFTAKDSFLTSVFFSRRGC
ncbi:MAG: hypothetical protein KatS3mg088_567 [Patescibacteria group bacterium]|nr:MAG: hypothetical protein KatS3mg088_567 [Patescibacteria group bacterium]